MAFITCKNLSLGYDGTTVLSDVNFSVKAGDYLCIVGENGSGKSTLVKSLLGLKKPEHGEIVFGNGLERNEIGYLPQQTDLQRDFPASVYEIVLSGRLNSLHGRPFFSASDKLAALKMMERLGISPLRNTGYQNLSGGQQQRVLLARAMCASKKLLLLDEPAAGLDPLVTGELYRLIRAANEEDGITIIMVSHDIPAAVRYAGHILHLGHRRLFFGTAAEYAASPLGHRFLGGDEDA